MVNEYLDGLEVFNELTGDTVSNEMRILLQEYHTTKDYYNIDALIFDSFFNADDNEMIKCLKEANINKLYVIDKSTILMHTICTLIANGFVVEGIKQIEKLSGYRKDDFRPALTFVRK